MTAHLLARGQYGDTSRPVEHPEFLRGSDTVRHRVDDPLLDPIAKGDLLLGWEGDPRYALYTNPREGRWELWRLEADNVYRLSVAVPGFVQGLDLVPWLITWLVEHDSTRGFDPAKAVIDEQVALEREKQRQADDHAEESADRLHHALMADVGHLEAGMSRRQFATPAAPTPTVSSTKESPQS